MKRGRIAGLALVLAAGAALYLLQGDRPAPGPGAGGAPAGGVAAADALADKAVGLDKAGQHQQSAAAFAEAARLAAAAGDDGRALKYRAQGAVCLKMSGQFDAAWDVMRPALDEARARGDRVTEGLALGNLARLASLRGDMPGASAWLDQLAELARAQGDLRLVQLTLEQAAVALLSLGDLDGALQRIEAGVQVDDQVPEAERRGVPLRALKAAVLLERGDDEGALALSHALPETPATLANRARMLARLGRHADAAELAVAAGDGFHAQGETHFTDRDRAWIFSASELLLAGDEPGCAERLRLLMAGTTDEIALAPFRVVRARLALRQDRAADAVPDLRLALEALHAVATPDERADVELLLAATELQSGRIPDAEARLRALPPSPASQLLLATLFMRHAPETTLAGEVLARLRPEAAPAADDSARRLRELLPRALPSLAVATLSCGLSDAERLGERGAADPAQSVLRDAAADALAWHALEARARLPGLRDAPGEAKARALTAAAWARGELPPDEAIVALLVDDTAAYLLLALPGSGATVFPLPPPSALRTLAARAVDALRSQPEPELIEATLALTDALLPEAARSDLAGFARWTLLLPDELMGLPPAAWVLDKPAASEAPVYLVERHVLALRPHVPAGQPAAAAAGVARWLDVSAPAVAPAGLPLAAAEWTARYGAAVLQPLTLPPLAGAATLTGAAAGASALRVALPECSALRIGAPGAGAGRLGGVLLAPSPGAPWGDEAAGLLPWHRWAALPLPPLVLLDGTRFEPSRPLDGPGLAATALLARARAALLSRWPLPSAVRTAALAGVQSALASGLALPEAVAAVQRELLLVARAAVALDPGAAHPRHWAAWLACGG